MARAIAANPPRMRRLGEYSAHLLLTCAAYYVAGRIGLSTPFTSNNISPFWPASGVALSAVLIFGYRVWPGIALAAFLVNSSAIPHVAALGLACGNTLSALTGAYLLRRLPKFDATLSRLRDVLGLIAFAALGSTMVSATIGVATLRATSVHPWSGILSAWLMYWLGDAMGVLLVAPLLLTLRDLWRICRSSQALELASLLLLLSLGCYIIFSEQKVFPVRLHVLAFAVFPFVLWAAIRFGVSGCALATLLIGVVATTETAFGSGPFSQNSPLTNALLLQAYFGVFAVSGLTLAADVAEREKLERERELLIREQAMREARLQLAAIVESSADAILSKDLDGTITHWNHAAEQLYGYSPHEAVGKSAALLTAPERVADFPEIMRRVRSHERIKDYETIHQRKDGSRVEVSLSVSPILDGNGKVVGAAAIARDISSRKRAEEALMKAEKLSATGRLAASIAHEINNPLESLINLMYLMNQSEKLEGSTREYLSLAQQELRRAAHITKQMLAFHRRSSHPTPIRVGEALDNVLELYAPTTRNSGITVVKRYERDVVIRAFAEEIHQVIANLVRNAIEAVGTAGTIRVHVWRSREWCENGREGARIVIADTGPGIASENRERIFEPFFTTKGENGTGLGLWISNGIVQKHGGSIRVRSSTRTPGRGTVFNIFLPSASTYPSSEAAKNAARA